MHKYSLILHQPFLNHILEQGQDGQLSWRCFHPFSQLQPQGHLDRYLKRDRLGMVVELKVQNCREKNLRIHFIPMRRFYGVQFLSKSVKSSVIFHQLFQYFLQLLKMSQWYQINPKVQLNYYV